MPIEYMKALRELYEKRGMQVYQFAQHDTAPLTPLHKPLSECRLGLMATGGIYHKDQPEYQDLDDFTFRELPKDVASADLRIHHVGYRHDDADKDINIVFPVERLRELEAQGVIRELASPVYTFMGRIYSRLRLQKEMAPELARKMKAQGIDAALLVPA